LPPNLQIMFIFTRLKAFLLTALTVVFSSAELHSEPRPTTLAEGVLAGLGVDIPTVSLTPPAIPTALGQIGAFAGHAAQASLASTDNKLMLAGLLGVPVAIACVAFVAFACQPSQPRGQVSRPRNSAGMPHQSQNGLTTRNSAGMPHQSQNGLTTASVPPGARSGSIAASHAYAPFSSSQPDPFGGSGTVQRLQTLRPLSVASGMTVPLSARLGGQQNISDSPLSMALYVKNPNGVRVRFGGTLSPQAEKGTVHVTNARDGTGILRVEVDEIQEPSTGISIQCKAETLAKLDTRQAVKQPGFPRPAPGQRSVTLHRVDSDDIDEACTPCALIKASKNFGMYGVHYKDLLGSAWVDEPSMTICTQRGTSVVDIIVDSKGCTIAKNEQESTKHTLWVAGGVDMALVACVVLAVQKLSS